MTSQVKLWAIQPGPMDKSELVERASRICYRSEMSETVEERMVFLGKLMRKGHLSVSEHARWVFMSGIDDPYRHYWPVRYGTNITPIPENTYYPWMVSWNARNSMDLMGNSPLNDHDVLEYDDLTDAEKLTHAAATFEIGGISRACSAQMNRHRVNSPSERSLRYVSAVSFEPIVPPSIAESEGAMQVFHYVTNAAREGYRLLQRDWGIKKEDARYVLPLATPTRLMITATFEHWQLFLAQRMPIAAQWEIRKEAANEIARQLAEVEPGLFGDLGE